MRTMDHGHGAPAVVWRLCHSPVGQKPNGQNPWGFSHCTPKTIKVIKVHQFQEGTVAEIPYFWVPLNSETHTWPSSASCEFCGPRVAAILQVRTKTHSQATFKQHSKPNPSVQNTKKEVHPLHPLHPLHPITFFRISNWSVATPKMPVPLFYSHTWDALINRSSKPYINRSSPYPFHYIHILSLLVFNSCLFHISCENWPNFRAFTTALNRAGTVTGACTVTAGHGCGLAPAHVVTDRGMNIYLPVNFPWKFVQKYQGCDLSPDHRSEGVNQKGVLFLLLFSLGTGWARSFYPNAAAEQTKNAEFMQTRCSFQAEGANVFLFLRPQVETRFQLSHTWIRKE